MTPPVSQLVVLFDLVQTLCCETLCGQTPDSVRLIAYPGIQTILAELTNRARLGVVAFGNDWNRNRLRRALHEADLEALFDPDLILVVIPAIKTSFAMVTQQVHTAPATSATFVSTSRRRRALALDAGFSVAPHPALAAAVLDGQSLVYIRATAASFSEASVEEALRASPPVLPTYLFGTAEAKTLFGIATQQAIDRLENVGVAVESLHDADPVETANLFVIDSAGLATESTTTRIVSEEAFFSHRLNRASKFIIPVDRGLLFSLRAQIAVSDLAAPVSCNRSLEELRPDPFLLASAPSIPTLDNYTLTAADCADLSQLDAKLINDYLTPWSNKLAGDSSIASRHVLHNDNMKAVAEACRLLGTICDARTVTKFRAENGDDLSYDSVQAEIPGSSNSPHAREVILLGAHLDSIAKNIVFNHDSAPGVDDDASGIAGVLGVARVLTRMSRRLAPLRTIRFVLFNAEEQGMDGSQRYAACPSNIDPVVASFQMDMIGFVRDDARPPLILEVHTGGEDDFPDYKGVIKQSVVLGNLVQRVAATLFPKTLKVQRYPKGFCAHDAGSNASDTKSFIKRNRPTCLVCEDFYVADKCTGGQKSHPTYHTQNDIKVDCAYAAQIAQVVAGAVWTAANSR